MKISWQGFFSGNHSWGIVAQNLSKEFIELNHSVDICSTNGYTYFPNDLIKYVKKDLNANYDLQMSYTAMPNFKSYFSHGNKNRFAIWNYEFTKLPSGHVRNHSFIDKLLPSSQFSYQIFVENKFPEEKMKVIPHGIRLEKFQNVSPMELKTNKKFKILANIAQPHIRKNIPGLLEAYGKAFSKKDDVCLVLKIVDKVPSNSFEVSFSKLYAKYKQKYSAECLILKDYVNDMPSLYAAVDAVFTMSHAECFYLPGIEGLASGKLIISPRYGGQLDFLNDNNSLLIDGKNIRAPLEAQYWEASVHSEMFLPHIDDAVEKLKYAYNHYQDLKIKFYTNSISLLKNYSWNKVANDIIKLSA